MAASSHRHLTPIVKYLAQGVKYLNAKASLAAIPACLPRTAVGSRSAAPTPAAPAARRQDRAPFHDRDGCPVQGVCVTNPKYLIRPALGPVG